jgi:hypothetical protein
MPVFTVPIDESNDCHTPAGSPAGGQFCTTGPGWYPRMVRHHDDALARLKALVPKASIALEERRDVPSAVAIRAAIVVADVLEKMKAQGYAMPDRVDVQLSKHHGPHGAVRGVRITDVGTRPAQVWEEKHLSIDLPDTLPDDANLDDAVYAVFSEETSAGDDPLYAGGFNYHRFTARTLKDIIVHEMGHVQAGHREGELNMAPMLSSNLFPSTAAITRAMKRVSIYASTSENEFLAEAFTRLYRGETLADDSMKLYRALRGPKVH